MERVGTANAYDQLVNGSIRLQALMFQQQKQLATGLKVENYADLATGSVLVQDLENDMSRTSGYLTVAQRGQSQVRDMHAVLKKMVDLVNRFKSRAAGALGTNGNAAQISSAAKGMMQELESLMNRSRAGEYGFGGTVTDREPVKIFHAGYTPPTAASGPDFSYFRGNEDARAIQIDEGQTVSIRVTARNSAVEKAIRAMGILANMGTYDKNAIKAAFDLSGQSIRELSNMQTDLSVSATAIKEKLDQHTDFQLRTEALLTKMTKADLGQTMAELNAVNANLQASYMAITKFSKMSLMDYLR